MATSDAGLTDEVTAELNPDPFGPDEDDDPEGYAAWMAARLAQQLPPVPPRPADDAAEDAWVDYCVALGADGGIARGTLHWDGEVGEVLVAAPLTKAELVELATRLGG